MVQPAPGSECRRLIKAALPYSPSPQQPIHNRPSQKLPAASDNVQNHTQVTEVVELDWTVIRDNCSFRNVFWKLQQAGTDKELIHPSQFVDCPLLLVEGCFFLLSPSKSLKPLRSNLLAATNTPHLTSSLS
jgi:hypothetical protein